MYTLCIMENQMLLGNFDIKYRILTPEGNMLGYLDRLHGMSMRRTMIPTLQVLVTWDPFPIISLISSPFDMYYVSCN